MEAAITGIGTANPPNQCDQLDAYEWLASILKLKSSEKRLLKSIYKSAGIQYRYSVIADYGKPRDEFEFFPTDPEGTFPQTAARMAIYKNHALNLALAAIQNCFYSSFDFDKKSISHLIIVSCTGMYAPGLDIEIVQTLKLPSSIKRTAIHFMGCYGAFNGMKIAESICKAEPNAKVLLVCLELCTIHFQEKMTLDNMISNAIFADGASAVLIERPHQQGKYFTLDYFYCDLIPDTSKEMAWAIANNGFDIVLSSFVPKVIEKGIPYFIQKLPINVKKIDYFAIHPGGLKILQACETALNLNESDNQYAYQVLKNYGNMSSATIFFVLKNIWDAITNNDHHKNIFSCAFGPGLTFESLLLKAHCY